MRRQLLSAVTTMGVVAALGAASLSGQLSTGGTQERFVATGSSGNNANPDCKGKNNTSCVTNPNGGGPGKSMTVAVTNPGTLYPTISRDVTVSVSNPQAFDIVVQTLNVVVQDSNKPGCVNGDLLRPANPINISMTVPAKGTSSTSFPVGLDANAPEACKSATWQFTVTATAVQR